jgi:acyl dehydratase
MHFIHVENLVRKVNFGLNKVRFIAPIPVGSRLRGRSIVLQAQQRADALLLTSRVRIEVEGQKQPACVAETLSMYFFNDKES